MLTAFDQHSLLSAGDHWMKGYFLSVICGSVVCGILTGLLEKKGTSGKILRLICGVFLTFTVIRPIADVRLDTFPVIYADWMTFGDSASAMGADYTAEAMSAIIKQEVQAYILDKAMALEGEIDAEVLLDESFIPCAVVLQGSISAKGKLALEQIIAEDLGIPKEEQRWNIS